jgi:hypothetical protein
MTMRATALAWLLGLAGCSESSTAAPPGVVKCLLSADRRCDCDTRDNPAMTEAACSKASLGAPSLCCAEPSFASSKNGGCSCTPFACKKSTASADSFCTCSAGDVTAAEEKTDTCTVPSGAKCCLDTDKVSCSCREQSDGGLPVTCFGTPVDSCTVDMLEKTCAAQFSSFTADVASCRD